MPPVGFEPTILAGERPKTYALDRAATGAEMFVSQVIFFNSTIIYKIASLITQESIIKQKTNFT